MDAEVVVVGGGPVGVGLAIDLAQRGVSVIVVERHHSIQRIPKGQNLTQRSGEHFQSWGVSQEIKARSPIPVTKASGGLTCYGSLLSSYRFDWFQRQSVRAYYAADSERLPQYETEAVLRERLSELPNAHLMLGWTFKSASQSDDEVEVNLVGTDGEGARSLKALYVVGCDGARSTVRKDLGIDQTISDPGKKMVLLTFRSHELDQLTNSLGSKAIYKVLRPSDEGYWNFFGRVDQDGGWFFHAPVPIDAARETYDFEAHLAAVVGEAFAFELEHVGFWDLRFVHANSYRKNRLFLAGDAAHSHPPYGGYGINTGFEDVRNLSWKLAAELQGWAGPQLLDSYHGERHPVFASTRDAFIAAYIRKEAEFLAEYSPEQDKDKFEQAWSRMADSDWDVQNFCPNYSGSSIIDDATASSPGAIGEHTLEAKAGFHLPPRDLDDGFSIYDNLGSWFSLIAVSQPQAIVDAFKLAAERLNVPMRIIQTNASPSVEAWGASLIVVRPDHFIGYCSNVLPADGDAAHILGTCVGHSATSVR